MRRDSLALTPRWRHVLAGRKVADVTSRADVERVLSAVGDGVVINAAAHTAVDRAEAEPDCSGGRAATSCAPLRAVHGIAPPSWRQAVAACLPPWLEPS